MSINTGMKVYYDHAFPSSWVTGQANQMVIDQFVKQLPDWMDDVLVMDPGFGKVDDVLNHYDNFNAKHKIAVCFNDTYSLCKEKADTYLGEGQYNVISLANYQQFWYFGFCMEMAMRDYKDKDFPLYLQNMFLNYNRKPKFQRVDLVERLKENNLFQRGLVTLGTWDGHAEIGLDENEDIAHGNDFNDCGIPNDITTLGDPEIWRRSFINLVSETSHSELFLTEKTVKPIVGKRPFIISGARDSLRLLQQWGFKTFSDYWPEHYDAYSYPGRHSKIIDVLNDINKRSDLELMEMYYDMQEILNYNHNHFFGEFRKENLAGLNNMADTYVDYYFGDTHEL
jgi:hypothetical protein